VRLSWLEKSKYVFTPFFRRANLTRNIGQTDILFVRDQGSLVGVCVQDYKSLCAAVTICATLVNIQTQTDTQTDSILTSLYE